MNRKKFKQPTIDAQRLKRALIAFAVAIGKRKKITGPEAFGMMVREMNCAG